MKFRTLKHIIPGIYKGKLLCFDYILNGYLKAGSNKLSVVKSR